MANGLGNIQHLSPKNFLTASSTSRTRLERFATLRRRRTSTKATPSGYKPAAPSPKKNPTAPPTGFAAIGSYNTIARRWTAIMVGIPVVVVTSYALYERLILGREQKSLSIPPEEPPAAKHV